jgi:hypothetical protein
MNSRFFESLERSRLGVGQAWIGAALGESPASVAAGFNQQKLDIFAFDVPAADPVTNRSDLFASPQFPKMCQAKEFGGRLRGP